MQNSVENHPDGCPVTFLRNVYTGNESAMSTTTGRPSTPPLLRKYRSLIEPNNTPFEYTSHRILPVKRLWAFLVRQENVSPFFIRHIFAKDPMAVTDRLLHTSIINCFRKQGSLLGQSLPNLHRANRQNKPTSPSRSFSENAKAFYRLHATMFVRDGSLSQQVVKSKKSTLNACWKTRKTQMAFGPRLTF